MVSCNKVSVLLLLVPTALAFGSSSVAQEGGAVHEGTVIMALNGKLTMLAMDGKTERTLEVARDAKITRDGHDCRLEDLRKGERISIVIFKRDNKEVVTKIDVAMS